MPESPVCRRCGAAASAYSPEGFCPACMLRMGLDSPFNPTDVRISSERTRFGDYELLGEIARGGMGVVYRARQVSLGRLVALKMILAGRLASEIEVRRFRDEARAAAALHHPNIVAIHEIGEIDGLPFFSMDLIDGPNLAEAVQAGPFAPERAAACVKAVADAIQHAHEQGILHRDLKPSNVLLDDQGRPRVTDFGLAKTVERDRSPGSTSSQSSSPNAPHSLTLSGQILGSPHFMPPEQAAAKCAELTVASDIYSLGALLYHLLTAQPPFQGNSLAETLRLVMETEAISPRSLTPAVPYDLEAICLKCLEKDPRHRYASAGELSEELGRFLDGAPIRARPIRPWERIGRWCRRNPVLPLLSVLCGVLTLAVTALSFVAARQSDTARERALEQERAALLQRAQTILAGEDLDRRFMSLEALATAAAIRPGLDLRNAAIEALIRPGLRPLRVWTKLSSLPVLDFDPSYEHYAQRNDDHVAAVHRLVDDVRVGGTPGLGHPLQLVRYSPDGRFLALGRGQPPRWLRVYELATGDFPFSQFLDFDGIDFSKDARQMAVLLRNGIVQLHELPTGRQTITLKVEPFPSEVRLSPNSSLLACIIETAWQVQVYDTVNGQRLHTLEHPAPVRGAAWHPDRGWLATAGDDGFVRLWDVASDREFKAFGGQHGKLLHLFYSESGDLLATWGNDGHLRIWNADTGRELLGLPASIQFSRPFGRNDTRLTHQTPTGHLVVSEFAAGLEPRTLSFGADLRQCAFSDDGHNLLATTVNETRIWALQNGKWVSVQKEGGSPQPVLKPHQSVQRSEKSPQAISQDGKLTAVADTNRLIHLLRPQGGTQLATLPVMDSSDVQALALSPDGTALAVVQRSGRLDLWDLHKIRAELARIGLDWD